MVDKAMTQELETLGNVVINTFSSFITTFDKEQSRLRTITEKNLTEQRQALINTFSKPIDETQLYSKYLELTEYIDNSSESLKDFSSDLGNGGDAFIKTIESISKSDSEIMLKETALRQAGIPVQRELIDNQFKLRVLTQEEIQQRQEDMRIANTLIEEKRSELDELKNIHTETGKLSDEQQERIISLSNNIDELDSGIEKIKSMGIEEVVEVKNDIVESVITSKESIEKVPDMFGFLFNNLKRAGESVKGAGEVVKKNYNKFADTFLPGPIKTAFGAFFESISQGVETFTDLFKPITGLVKTLYNLPKTLTNFFAKDGPFNKAMESTMKGFKKFSPAILLVIGGLTLLYIAIQRLLDLIPGFNLSPNVTEKDVSDDAVPEGMSKKEYVDKINEETETSASESVYQPEKMLEADRVRREEMGKDPLSRTTENLITDTLNTQQALSGNVELPYERFLPNGEQGPGIYRIFPNSPQPPMMLKSVDAIISDNPDKFKQYESTVIDKKDGFFARKKMQFKTDNEIEKAFKFESAKRRELAKELQPDEEVSTGASVMSNQNNNMINNNQTKIDNTSNYYGNPTNQDQVIKGVQN